MPEKLKKSKT